VPAPPGAGAGSGTMTAQIGPSQDQGGTAVGYLRRKVRVQTLRNAVFAKGMVAEDDINLNGNQVKSDSYNSTDPDQSTDGQYDATKAGDKGDIATNSGLIDSLNVGNAVIYGTVSTGKGGSVAIGPNGAVGNTEWHDQGSQGIQPGAFTDDMNAEFDLVDVPFDSGYTIPGGQSIDNVTYDYVLGGGNYQLNNFGGNVLI